MDKRRTGVGQFLDKRRKRKYFGKKEEKIGAKGCKRGKLKLVFFKYKYFL